MAIAARSRHLRRQDRSQACLCVVVCLPSGEGASGGPPRRSRSIEHNWFFRYLTFDESAIGEKDRAVYAAAYNCRDCIRAGNAWYQAFTQDVIDEAEYGKLEMPVLALGGPGYTWLKATLTKKAPNLRVELVEGSGHFIPEEKPEATVRYLLEFLD